MSRAWSIAAIAALALSPAMAHGEACGFVDAPTSMTAPLQQMSAQLKAILETNSGSSTDRPECKALAEQMSRLAASPLTYQAESNGQPNPEQVASQQKLIALSTEFFQKRCDQWVGENATKGLAVTTLGIARSFLATTALVPGFQLPVLAVGTLTDLVFGALERLFNSRSVHEQLADHEKLLDQQALLCAYFEHVTQVDESLTDDALEQRRRQAQDAFFIQQRKVQELEALVNACSAVTSSTLPTTFNWEDWKKIRSKLEGETDAERYFSLLDRIQSAEWNGEIAQALKRVCSPDETPNPTEQQKAVCFYHRKLVDLLASPERDQTAILKAYENLIVGIGAAQVFGDPNSSGSNQLNALKAQLAAEQAILEKLRIDKRGLSDNDEVRRSGIFDRIRLRGKEMLAGTSGQKGVLRAHVEILQESIRRNLDQVPISDLLRKVRNNRNEVRCETDIKPILQPLRATVAHVRLIHRVCSRFAGRDRPTFRDASLNFTQVDSRLEGYCSDEMEKSRERLVKPQELYDTLLRELPDCTRDWPR